MVERTCDREFEVLECAAAGRAGDELRGHLAGCATCREIFDVASSIAEDRRELIRGAQLPSAGLVWWRTQVRARNESARVAFRAAAVVQLALVGVATIASAAILGVSVGDARRLFTLPLVGGWVILAAVAIYFGSRNARTGGVMRW